MDDDEIVDKSSDETPFLWRAIFLLLVTIMIYTEVKEHIG